MPSAELSKCCTRAAFQLFSLCPVWGPTQGFVLGPICPLVCGSNRPNRCSARAQVPQYADGCQIYVATSVRAVHSAVDQLSGCLHDVDVWMSASRLRLNASKTQVLWLGITSTDSRFVRYKSSRLLSASSAQHATSALSLTAGCQWPTTWRQSVAQHTIICGRLDPHCSLCHETLQRHSRRSSPVAWTTATQFCTV